ncbi:MAG: lipid A biosynthesis acyltransferase [Sulfurospirillum sp.]|nr:lipid A biosynthesis acyltransferase [Sulfurospirillum sp.]MBL0703288.1 lipid A biosynthesis acyltransferase [Sulfurospirillum sp.]
MLDYVYLILFKLFVFFIKYVPRFITDSILNFFAFFIYKIDSRHKKVAKVNLDLVYEDRKSERDKKLIIKKCYKNLLFNMRDFVENQDISEKNLLKKVTIHNEHFYTNVHEAGKGVIFLTAHYGNWELLPLCVGANYGKLWGVGRNLDSKKMNDVLQKNRNQFNVHMLEKTGAIRGLLKALKAGENVGLLVDQNTSEKEGILINFFGKLARHTPSAALIARKTQTPIIPAYITTDDYQNYDITFYEPIITDKTDNSEEDIRKSVQAQADITQKIIEKKPDEWFWLHRRWKSQHGELYK